MKKLKAIVLAIVLSLSVLCATFMVTGCNTEDSEQRSKYTILATYDAENQHIDATLTLNYINNSEKELSNVMFHLYPNAFREGAVFSPIRQEEKADAFPNGVNFGDFQILNVTRDGEEKLIAIVGQDEDILNVDGSLMPADSTTIKIDFMLDLPNVRHRYGWEDGIANLGNWYPIVCMIKGGEWDQTPYYANGDPFNSEIADYEVSITVPQKYTVATSGRQTVETAGTQKIVTAKIEKSRDFAAVIGEFKVNKKVEGGVEINYYYVEDGANGAHLTAAADSLRTFSEVFGKYAYETLSVVKNPFLYGGMEYPALVYISDELNDKLFTEVIVHEVAHQWWYAAVGNDQVREAWLDEGMAEYSTTIFYERNPVYEVKKNDRLASSLSLYLLYCEKWKNNGLDDTSMNRTVAQYANSSEYNVMTYVKGQLMLDSLRESIGDKAFFEGLKNYYSLYQFKRATMDDFIGVMETASKTNLKSFFDSWVEGKVKMFAS